MDFLLIITILCITLSTLLTPCSSHRALLHYPPEQSKQDHVTVVSLAKLPRKMRPIEVPVANVSVHGDYKSYSAKSGAIAGKGKRWRQKSSENRESETWELMTMDYSRVRRRRPIHNKAVPLTP